MNILVTGGHLTPALAIIDYLKINHGINFIFAGRIWSQKKNGQKAHEKEEVKKRNIKFITVKTGNLLNFKDFFSLIKKTKNAKKILVNEKIDLVFSFGSFIALPFAIAAKKMKIPIITHEQTTRMGLTNKFISLFANEILLTYPIKTLFPQKTKIIGNFLREELTKKTPIPNWLKNEESKKILYITGGSQGSLFINNLIKDNLKFLLEKFIVIHQCGNPTKTHNYENELKNEVKKLDENLQKKYYPKAWIKQDELAFLYQNASIMIARSGANTVLEISYFKIPTFFIPYPYARFNEQFENANVLAKKNQCLIRQQDEINNKNFLETIIKLDKNQNKIKTNLEKIKISNGLSKVNEIIKKYI
jgi:UDP-N-acetylglucosamine--N-acetylmuramyl-(pentapeptide) pyrophosphoryl-undecaprenol N-acetylglucosamine transferase